METVKKVKIISIDGGQFMQQFVGQVGTLSGSKGVSGQTELVNLEKQGTGLFLRPEQIQPA